MSRNIEMNYKTDTAYEPLYPQTTCDMVIDLLNTDTKSLMGLPTTATGDDAFRELFLAITLDGRALINFTVMGDDGTPCKGVQIESSAFCDSNGNLTSTVETNDEGKVSVFCNNTSVSCSIANYANLSNWSDSYAVTFGEVYDKAITLTRYDFRLFESSGNYKFSPEIVRVDVSCCGGGGAAYITTGWESDEYSYYYYGGGGGGGYGVKQEQVSFSPQTLYPLVVGQGAIDTSADGVAPSGGSSSFLNVTAQGGGGGNNITPYGGIGNGNGGTEDGGNGTAGTQTIYSSMSEEVLVGGGGGAGGFIYTRGDDSSKSRAGGTGGSPNGGTGGNARVTNYDVLSATNAIAPKKYGGGGSSGGLVVYNRNGPRGMKSGSNAIGAQGCVAIRMYTQSTLPA